MSQVLRQISYGQAKELYSLGLYVCCTHEKATRGLRCDCIRRRCLRKSMFHYEMGPDDPFDCFVLVEESND